MLDWSMLLNEDRRRKSTQIPDDVRTQFERDYDRIIYMSSFRRMKDKAQVFPLEKDDFVRTRLTHSLEVSTLGRSFGVDVAKHLLRRNLINNPPEEFTQKISSILSTTCLLHDIGNPPFGHFGEESIRTWFTKYFIDNKDLNLSNEQKLDFLKFEGNAQTLRIITYLQALQDEYGINLTFGSLASMIKYVASSDTVNKSKGKHYSKVGYFQSEKVVFDEIQKKTGLNGSRHPLVFLMEAADDIAYSAIDVEDSLQKNTVSYEEFIEFMQKKLTLEGTKKVLNNFITNITKLENEWGKPRAKYIAGVVPFLVEIPLVKVSGC